MSIEATVEATAELYTAVNEAVKRNERTSAALQRTEKALDRLASRGNAVGGSATLRQAFLDAEARHQDAHKALITLGRQVREALRTNT